MLRPAIGNAAKQQGFERAESPTADDGQAGVRALGVANNGFRRVSCFLMKGAKNAGS